jgi:drug/metabolite transporter (DMT)-like permease
MALFPDKDQKISRLHGQLYVLVAALMWSSGGFFAKAPAFDAWDVNTRGILLAFWRALFAGLILLPFIRQRRWSWMLIPMVTSFTLMNVTFLSSMSLSEASVAIWLQNTAPVWVFLGGVIWLRERVQLRDGLMLAFCLTGVGVILAFELRGERPLGVWFGLASGVCYAGVVLALRGLKDYDAFWLVSLNQFATALVLAPVVLSAEVQPTGTQILMLAAFGVFQMGIPYVLFSRGLRSLPGHEASCITLLEPVLLPLWVFLAWGQAVNYQAPSKWTLWGAALILVGLLVRYLRVGHLRASSDS